MKRLLTYGLLLLTILASHFVVSACQDDLPETTEVMMTFTTRAVVSDIISSDAPDEDKMKDLRVIMLRQDGTVVDNHLEPDINASSVTFTFTTPIQTGGEDFTFLAVANEGSIQSTSKLSWLSCSPGDKLSEETITQIKEQQIGDGSAFNINKSPIPQTKQWTVTVPQQDTHVEKQTLDFVASKISVQFINTYDAAQTLSNIHITGITPNGMGRLFNEPTGEKDDKGEEIYKEVYVDSDVTLNEGKIDFGSIDVGAATNEGSTPTASAIKHYYTYPVDKDNISSPTLHAKWNEKNYTLPLEGITELKRNDHLKIIVTLTGHALTINYSIAPWVEEPTNIGSPTTNGGYQVDGWGNGNDIIIGGEIGGGDTPGGGGTGEVEVTVWGDKEGEGNLTINWESSYLTVQPSWFNQASIVKGKGPNNNNIDGFQMYVYYDYTGNGSMEVREETGKKKYIDKVYINEEMKDWLDLNGERVSIFVPYDIRNTPFTLSGVNYTITEVTVVK